MRHRGGGLRRKIKNVDLAYSLSYFRGTVLGYDFDSIGNRTCPLFLLYFRDLGVYSYILAAKDVKLLDSLEIKGHKFEETKSIGSVYKLKYLPVNTKVFNLENKPGMGGKLSRAAGTWCKIIRHYLSPTGIRFVHLKLPSNESHFSLGDCSAIVGTAANAEHRYFKLGTAGRARRLGRRPKVRGVAMNPVDHPHGGGEGKTSGGRPSVSAWAYPTKGYRTRSKRKEQNKKEFIRKFNKNLI